MSILSWLGRRIGLLDGEFWRAFYGGETWAGETITPETAMQVSAFWACTRLISQTVATLPLSMYERRKDGSRELRGDLPLHKIIHDMPNADSTAVEFWEGMVASLCISGNAFAEKVRNTQGQLIGLTPLCADWVCVERDPKGALRYRYRPVLPFKAERIIPEADMLHVRGFGFGGDVGLSPIAFARQSLSAARAVDRSAATVFANGMRPSGWLLYKGGTLTPEQREQARKSIIEPMQGSKNTGRTGILEADFDYKQITIPPEDAQMLQTRQFNVEDVCRWLGVPPILIGHAATGQTMWGSGVEQIMLGWLTLGLRPYLTRIEQAIKRALIPPADREVLYAEFNVEGLLRADSAGRASLYSSFAQNGIMTRNEIRAKENLPRQEDGGDELTIQVNLQPLSAVLDPAQPAVARQNEQIKAALRQILDEPDSNVVPLKQGGTHA